jgi:hypothetical protein
MLPPGASETQAKIEGGEKTNLWVDEEETAPKSRGTKEREQRMGISAQSTTAARTGRKRNENQDSYRPSGKYFTGNRLALAAAAQDFSRERKVLGEIWVEKTGADFTGAKMEAEASAERSREISGDHRIEGAAKKKRSDLSISSPVLASL